MMAFFANIFGYVLNFMYNIIGNYGIAIILFSILIKILMIPISIKQQKTMKKSTKLQAKLKEIQVKYKGNPEKLNQETMELYKKENMSPFSGCLSAIVQLILLLAVFYLVKSPLTHMTKIDAEVIDKYTTIMKQYEMSENTAYPEIELINEIDNIKKLKEENKEENSEKISVSEINNEELDSMKINMDFLGVNLAQVPTKSSDWKAYIIPVLYVLISIASMKITMATNPTTKKEKKEGEEEFDMAAQMNKNMTFMFPFIYVSVALIAPLGLALYWLMNSLLLIIEKLILSKVIKEEEEE